MLLPKYRRGELRDNRAIAIYVILHFFAAILSLAYYRRRRGCRYAASDGNIFGFLKCPGLSSISLLYEEDYKGGAGPGLIGRRV